jgi:hypothetical protein
MADTLKAYAVQEDTEGAGGIVFAKRDIVARRLGADEFNGGEFGGLTCRRAPWADKYAPGPVPFAVKFAHGWWVECSGCGVKIVEEGEYDENGDELEFDPADFVELGTNVFHSKACYERHIASRSRIEAKQREMIDLLRARLVEKLPGVTFDPNDGDHAYVTEDGGHLIVRQVRIAFRFPGCAIGAAQYRLDEPQYYSPARFSPPRPEVTVCHGDLAAWNAWRESVKAREPA